MKKYETQFDVISVGSALRDVMFYSDDFVLVDNPSKDPTRMKLLGVEFGAKLRSDNVHFSFGGGAANTAVNFSGLGLRTAIATGIGDDFDGHALQQHLETQGVALPLLQKSFQHRTGFSFLSVDENSGEHVAHIYYGAAQDIDPSLSALKRHSTNWYYISSLNAKGWRKVLKNIFDQNTQVAWNPGSTQLTAGVRALRRFMKKTAVLIVNRDEAAELILSDPQHRVAGPVRPMLKKIHAYGPKIVVITDGRKGSYVYDGTTTYFHKTPQDKPKDTTGAGDCYGSSFISGLIRYNGDIEKSMKLATTNASHLVRSIGAQNGLLSWRQLPKSLRKT